MENNFIDVTINGKVYHLLHLISEEEKERGLMDVESMDDDEGALFDYSDNPQEALDFWMHDTDIPLSICFVNEDKTIISVKEGIPNTDDYISESSEFIAYVIEVNKGESIKPGDKISFGIDTSEMEPGKLYMLNENGDIQKQLAGGERIFSRKSSSRILELYAKTLETQDDLSYIKLGRYIFKELQAQDSREPEYVNT